jgi:hypothetical protein
MDSDKFGEEDEKGINVPFLDLESILVATASYMQKSSGRGAVGLFTR